MALPQRKVEVVPHDPGWRKVFEAEALALGSALGDNAVAIHHIGSTAIPGIFAKPVIDILIEVQSLENLDASLPKMQALGYEGLGEHGIPERRFYLKEKAPGERSHHIHAFLRDSEGARRHLAFRDYLRAHPDEAKEYCELKRGLAQAYPLAVEKYIEGKDALVKKLELKAIRFAATKKPDAV